MEITTVTSKAIMSAKPESEKLLKRIGSTTYEVNIHFSKTNNQTLNDKILKLIEREVNKIA